MHAYAEPALVKAALDDWRTAAIPEGLRATLGFLEKLNADPSALTVADLLPLREAGVSDEAIREAVYVCFMFSVIVRLADTFDFALPTEQEQASSVSILTKLGYGTGSIPG